MGNSELGLRRTLAAATPPESAASADGKREQLEAGARCGEYVVERFLGAGAMGEVYAGRHPVIGKRVAIKILKRELSASPEAAERFVREARAVNQVDHPNVIDVFAFGTLESGRLYLVMELVDGRSLRQAVQDGPLAVPVALDVLCQIAEALDAAHARGVVHRDLKPDNVMLAGDPVKAFVLDFGIAKLVVGNQTLNGNGTLTGEGSWLGTPGYMAPEQWSAEGAGPASDRYALGVMAFELLAGKLPFQAPTLPQMMEQHFRAPVPALATKRGVVRAGTSAPPATLDPVLARAMAKDPTQRYPTARELVAALREAAAGRRVRGLTASRPLWMPALAGASVLGVAIVAVIATREPPRPTAAAGATVVEPTPPPPTGQVLLKIVANPPGSVVRDGAVLGLTPHDVAVTPGERVALVVKRLGYAPAPIDLVAPRAAQTRTVELAPVVGFRGTWRMADGKLRRFERVDEHVMGYKLESLDDTGRAYRRFELVDPASRQLTGDVAWFANETTNEGPHPSCQVAFEVVYAYRQQPELLELKVGLVTLRKQHDGTCVQVKRTTEVERLARVSDGGDEVVIRAPVGKPPVAVDDDQAPANPVQVPPKQRPPTKGGKPVKGVRAPAPQDLKEPPVQGQRNAKSAVDAPSSVQQQVPTPRGDSQIAPQLQKK